MNETERLLTALRDIHEPAVPTGVSLWLIAANLAALLLIIAAVLFRRHRRREGWRRQALQQIAAARAMAPQAGLLMLARTVRQIMMVHTNEAHSGPDWRWLESLDQTFRTRWFTQAKGQVFGPALYTSATRTADVPALCDQLQRLVMQLPSVPHRQNRPDITRAHSDPESRTEAGADADAGAGAS